jgi:hypothetical protein
MKKLLAFALAFYALLALVSPQILDLDLSIVGGTTHYVGAASTHHAGKRLVTAAAPDVDHTPLPAMVATPTHHDCWLVAAPAQSRNTFSSNCHTLLALLVPLDLVSCLLV